MRAPHHASKQQGERLGPQASSVEQFVPPEEVECLMNGAVWDEETQDWCSARNL